MVGLPVLLLALQASEADYFEIVDFTAPEGVLLEVSGLLPSNEDLYIATRRGEIWHVKNALSKSPRFSLWAEGLQEPLGH